MYNYFRVIIQAQLPRITNRSKDIRVTLIVGKSVDEKIDLISQYLRTEKDDENNDMISSNVRK